MGDESRFRYRRDDTQANDGRVPRMERPTARDAAPASRADEALAELARLIGDEDPFADFNDPRRAPPPVQPEANRAPAGRQQQAAPAPAPDRRYDDWQPGRRGMREPPPGTPAHMAPTRAAARPDEWTEPNRASVRQGYGSLSRRPDPAAPQEGYEDEYYEEQQPAPQPPERTVTRGGAFTQAAARHDHRDAGLTQRGDYAPQRDEYTQSRTAAAPAQPTARQAQHDPYAQDEAGYAYTAQSRHPHDEQYDEAYDPAYTDDGYMPPHDEDFYEPEPRRKNRTLIVAALAVVAVAVVGVGGVFAYKTFAGKGSSSESASGQPPVIRAGEGPVKTAGPAPTQTSDGQKLIYDRVGGGNPGNERVVPREEQPVDVNAAAAAAAAAQAANPTEPKKVRTLTVRADGSVVNAPSPVPAPPPGVAPIAFAPNQNPVPSGAPAPTPVQTASVAAPAAAPAAPPPAAAPGSAGGFVVQVASQKSEADALGSFKVLQSRYPQLLGTYKASVKKADLGERGIYYRAQVGPFTTREQANDLCQSLRAQGADCLVQKN
ncbi:septal ring-binding cell division protein DamX [Azorhizobium sp. AG788]|uniref:SPOR domain-containing protein n=1 Tax=Azorhizobium sp. AG788 TaxID=2183897 RepID=UPI0010610AD0|nr:SPOR domain-containing protein [Azorhizobium sp. AG788]TDT90304.1 septal ring-binding cell division protein DamX [Azorhizobium sp. AG788]